MRPLYFLVALSIGMANTIVFSPSTHADEIPAKWCSSGFGSPAEFSRYSKAPGGWLLKIAGQPDEWFDDEADELTSAEVVIWMEGLAEPKQHVWIIRDRVFWACK